MTAEHFVFFLKGFISGAEKSGQRPSLSADQVEFIRKELNAISTQVTINHSPWFPNFVPGINSPYIPDPEPNVLYPAVPVTTTGICTTGICDHTNAEQLLALGNSNQNIDAKAWLQEIMGPLPEVSAYPKEYISPKNGGKAGQPRPPGRYMPITEKGKAKN